MCIGNRGCFCAKCFHGYWANRKLFTRKDTQWEPPITDTMKSGQPPYNGQTVHPLPVYCPYISTSSHYSEVPPWKLSCTVYLKTFWASEGQGGCMLIKLDPVLANYLTYKEWATSTSLCITLLYILYQHCIPVNTCVAIMFVLLTHAGI